MNNAVDFNDSESIMNMFLEQWNNLGRSVSKLSIIGYFFNDFELEDFEKEEVYIEAVVKFLTLSKVWVFQVKDKDYMIFADFKKAKSMMLHYIHTYMPHNEIKKYVADDRSVEYRVEPQNFNILARLSQQDLN